MQPTSTENQFTPQERREADIALLKSLRQRTLDLVVDSRAYGSELSGEFGRVRDSIDHSLAWALLRRELES
jgi:hypothetical protein